MKRKGSVVGADHPIVQKKIDDSLKLSVREGSMASISAGLGLSYLSPFVLFLNATAAQMGILHAVVSLLPGLAQLKTAALVRRFSRKKIVLTGVMGRTLLWLPILLVGVLFYLGVPHMAWVAIFLIGLCYVFISVANPAWISWMGSLVPGDRRGKYFSRRNRVMGFFSIVTMIVGAIFLDWAKDTGARYGNVVGFTLLGFGALFVLSMIFKFWSWNLLRKQYEPRLKVRKKDYFTFWQFLDRCTSTPFGRFSLFRVVLSFSVAIAMPFWVVYMLRDLSLSYLWYIMITASSIVFQLVFLPLLGKFSDRFGNVKLMKVCSWLIALVPLFWIASAFIGNIFWTKIYLLFVPSIIGGFAWGGYNLAVNNYVFDAVSSRKRSFGAAYMNLMVGVGMFVGASLGSLLAWLNISFMNPLLFIFAISAVGRFFVAMFGPRLLHEVRHVKKFSSDYLIREFQPIQGVVREVHSLEYLVKKVDHYL